MTSQWVQIGRCLARSPALFLFALLVGCVDTREVIVEPNAFEDPPAAAAGFVGYAHQDGSKPVCGNCHMGKYGAWQGTRHAGAWQTLQASGSAQASCEGCHTVNERGNATTAPGGHTSTKDPRYRDVQCESCHGPGMDHITNPDASQPLASIEVGSELENGCGECHQGKHTPYVEEWESSRHGKRNTYPQGNPNCHPCHEARGALAKFGVQTDFVEAAQTAAIPVTCAVCHDAHAKSNPAQLRFPIDVADVSKNLCMKCHYKRAEPELTSGQGAHSPQGPMLLGENVGWVPPNLSYDNGSIVATHGSEKNPRLCAGCHVVQRDVKDASGSLVIHSTGHTFKAIPCLDASGAPTASSDCTLQQRSFAACTTAGCHGTEAAARNALSVTRARLDRLAKELSALVAKLPASEFSTTDGRISTAEGAKFNAGLATQLGTAIHNPFLMEALLTATIKQVQTEYGVSASPSLVLDNLLGN